MGREWIAQERTLPVFLSMLKNVQRFQLERSASMQISWIDLPKDLKDALTGILATPTLLELSLVGLVFDRPADLHSMLQACQNLRLLEANHLLLRDASSLAVGSPESRQRAPLDVLDVGPRTSTALIDCLLHPESSIDVTTIRKLSIAISGNFANVAKLLRSTSSIEALEIVLMNDGAHPASSFSLTRRLFSLTAQSTSKNIGPFLLLIASTLAIIHTFTRLISRLTSSNVKMILYLGSMTSS